MNAARTNLTSQEVRISNNKLGEGTFRICLEGTYVGGNRNGQVAACKRFKSQYRQMEDEMFEDDFRIADKVISLAEKWNEFCPVGHEIVVSRGDVKHSQSGIPYLIEPLVRYFTKYTSNSGTIISNGWQSQVMEAFAHYTYHATGGWMLVCDIQGRYRPQPRKNRRFELSDPAICSRKRNFGPTDLGEKGIDSFFANHDCNRYCESSWHRPRNPQQWFPFNTGTSMMSSLMSEKLKLHNRTTFRTGMNAIIEEDSDCESWC